MSVLDPQLRQQLLRVVDEQSRLPDVEVAEIPQLLTYVDNELRQPLVRRHPHPPVDRPRVIFKGLLTTIHPGVDVSTIAKGRINPPQDFEPLEGIELLLGDLESHVRLFE